MMYQEHRGRNLIIAFSQYFAAQIKLDNLLLLVAAA
jgi:hypothetical protein